MVYEVSTKQMSKHEKRSYRLIGESQRHNNRTDDNGCKMGSKTELPQEVVLQTPSDKRETLMVGGDGDERAVFLVTEF